MMYRTAVVGAFGSAPAHTAVQAVGEVAPRFAVGSVGVSVSTLIAQHQSRSVAIVRATHHDESS